MKSLQSIFIALFICFSFNACDSNNNNSNMNNVEVSGVLEELGITTFQYGTHTIGGYALRSSSVSLDDFVGQSVTVVGTKIAGYPVDGGPEYLDVTEVK